MLSFIKAKIQDESTLSATLTRWRLFDQKIVFTNGCFDLLHYGHIHYLAAAKALGDKLIIGVNSTKSVKKLKGEHRPINDDLTRFHLLASLSFVDAIIEFDEATPYKLIKTIQPNILVKGGDWQPDQIIGADLVLANGGIVKSLAFIDGYSTTKIEVKIKNEGGRG